MCDNLSKTTFENLDFIFGWNNENRASYPEIRFLTKSILNPYVHAAATATTCELNPNKMRINPYLLRNSIFLKSKNVDEYKKDSGTNVINVLQWTRVIASESIKIMDQPFMKSNRPLILVQDNQTLAITTLVAAMFNLLKAYLS